MARLVEEIDIALPHPALPEGEWADAYRVTSGRRFASARAAGEAAFADFPAWVHGLMALRNVIVAPLGLKTGRSAEPPMQRVGFFPLILQTNDQLVVGMNDRHLDFRCVVDLANDGRDQAVTISTIIKRHNWLGRAYLATILPFHRLILRTIMMRLANA